MKERRWLDILNAICSSITALAALFTLIIVLYPQIKPSNVNHNELANAGVVDSQMFLVNHYYRIGNLSESVYWYSVASQTEGEHQAKAINNLAYIYLTMGEQKISTPSSKIAVYVIPANEELAIAKQTYTYLQG